MRGLDRFAEGRTGKTGNGKQAQAGAGHGGSKDAQVSPAPTVRLMDGRMDSGPLPILGNLSYLSLCDRAPYRRTTPSYRTHLDCATVDSAAPRVTRLPVLKVEV